MLDGRRTTLAEDRVPPRTARASCAVPVQALGLRYAAIVGFAAILILSVHRSTTPVRGSAPVITACHNSIAWTVALPGTAAVISQASHVALHGAFWVGLLSLASGVAIVQLASLLRTVRIGSRCGH